MSRLFGAFLTLLGVLVVSAQPAAASCAPPAPIADNAARATAVVHGTVIDGGQHSVTFRVDKALKGNVASTITVLLGPGRGGVAATSVDYSAPTGTDHVLYLIRGDDGQLETNACIGSHSGPPTTEEIAFFGAGTTVPGSGQADPVADRGGLQSWAPWAAAALAAGLAFALLRLRGLTGSDRP